MTTKGGGFYNKEIIDFYRKFIIPQSYIITPNIPESEIITGIEIKTSEDVKKACIEIKKMGAKNVIIKGGHSVNNVDTLYDGKEFFFFKKEKLKGEFHGTGCIFASLIAGYLYKGDSLYLSFKKTEEKIKTLLLNSVQKNQSFYVI